jgi:quercetin dioxygenase-like cupin family protein
MDLTTRRSPSPGDALHPETLPADTLRDIARGFADADPTALLPLGDERRWSLVVRTEAYEAWVIAWPPGTGLGMHDHDGSAAAIAVVSGRLHERFLADGVSVRELQAGDLVSLPPDHVHEVVNRHDVETVSIHVYSPPLGDTSFRDDPSITVAVVGAATD